MRDTTIIPKESGVGTTQFGGSDNETKWSESGKNEKKKCGYDVKKGEKTRVTYPCRTTAAATKTRNERQRTDRPVPTDDQRLWRGGGRVLFSTKINDGAAAAAVEWRGDDRV